MQIDTDYIKTNGYAVLPNFLNTEEVTALQNLCDATPVAMGETWNNEYKPNLPFNEYMHWWSQTVKDHPVTISIKQKILPMATQCFGEGNFEQVGGDFKVTNAGSQYMYCHFDTPYRHDRWANDFSDDIKGMQFGIALDKFDNESGGTRVLPGSHKKIYHKEDMDAGKHNDEFLRDGITMELEPGGLFCYHSRTMHSTMPNNTDKPRRLMLILHLWNDPAFRQELTDIESNL